MATIPPIPKSFEDARLRSFEVEKELERICSAVHFRTSKRACEFLRYVVRVTLDGRMDSLKERSIGIDLMGRDVSYDPSSDAIVRVRANDVRKRLSSYYASTESIPAIQIQLSTGTYIPSFIPGVPARDKSDFASPETATTASQKTEGSVLPLSHHVLMTPAVLALLLCVLLMRHQWEDRESYLRFWDHILGGRNTLRLSIAPQDQSQLAPSLYPIAWLAGRYGVDTVIEDSPVPENKTEQLATVQESFATPLSIANDGRLRWIMTAQSGVNRVTDRNTQDQASPPNTPSAALLTILPEDTAALHIQGTDDKAINRLLEDLTSQKHFPDGIIDQLSNRHVLQVLLLRGGSGQWQTQIFSSNF
jgi:hypothetical protein